MKELMKILGALFLSMTILLSCGDDKKSKKSKKDREINIEDLDKNIENEEDAIEAMITIMKDKMELVDKAIGPPLLMMDDEDLEDRSEDISDAMDDVYKVIYKEGLADDLEDADNWDKYEDIQDELEDLMADYFDLLEEERYSGNKASGEASSASGEEYYEGDYINYAVEKVACDDDCQKACCLGCKATVGDKVCVADHSCCAETQEVFDDYKTPCFVIIFNNLNEDTRPEVFADMGIPSNEDIANCVCNKLPEMTDEELIEWVDNDDMDPINNQEDKEQIEVLIRCMGFDSLEDYMEQMMQMMQEEMEAE